MTESDRLNDDGFPPPDRRVNPPWHPPPQNRRGGSLCPPAETHNDNPQSPLRTAP